MRVAIVAESFLPQTNGVTNSVLRMLDYLIDNQHEAVVLAPEHEDGVPSDYRGVPIETLPSMSLPMYATVKLVTSPTPKIKQLLSAYNPDVVHLASPFILGYKAALAAADLEIPMVAIYQTEVPSYAQRYGFPPAEPALWYRVRQIHNLAYATYAPSTVSQAELISQGVARVDIWGRGVDSKLYQPSKRSEALHQSWASQGECVIGYMGRLAKEKQVENLAPLADVPGIKIVIIGDGPARAQLEKTLPNALFLGLKKGEELAQCLASLDLFVHTGEYETFGQAIQEAQACGLAVVAPAKGGPIDLVADGVDGLLYPPGDVAALKDAVVSLVNNPDKLAQFGDAARKKVADKTWDSVCAEMVEHYEEAIQASKMLEW